MRRAAPPSSRSTASSILLSAAPFTHLYGLFSVNLALTTGAATAILPTFTPAALAAALDHCRPTGLFVAPAHMSACLNEGLLTRERLASLRFVLISGSVCPPALAHAVQERMPNGEVLQLWGMSEMQAGTFTRPGDPLAVRTGSAGRASPGTRVARRRRHDAACPPAREGELQARGASVFAGYLDNADATAAAFTADGWFRTGDLARLDAAGNLRDHRPAEGRDQPRRRQVQSGRRRSDRSARHAAVAQCAIVPMPDPVLGERACCFVVLKPGAARDARRSARLARPRTRSPSSKWPERLEIIDDMPLTPTRKIKKAELARAGMAVPERVANGE